MKSRSVTFVAVGTIAAVVVAGSIWWTSPAKSVPLSDVSHIHGIAVDPVDSARLYLATHYGVWRTAPDGTAAQISENRKTIWASRRIRPKSALSSEADIRRRAAMPALLSRATGPGHRRRFRLVLMGRSISTPFTSVVPIPASSTASTAASR